MASPANPRQGYLQSAPSELPFLQDELLEEIFLRLPTAADLARASMASPTFRRVITGHPFLRRFRTLHPPPLLGIISVTFRPAQPPHPSAAAARAFAAAARAFAAADVDFRCSFLPSADQFSHRDFRDGRALLSGDVPEGSSSFYDYKRRDFVSALTTLAVCDPVHRGYLLLPAVPDELAALVHQPDILDFEPFLAPPGEDEDDSSFRVMCLTQCTTKLVLFIFSSCAGKWQAVTFDSLIALMTSPDDNQASGSELTWVSERYYAHKCFCWAVYQMNKLLMLDTRVMEFSAVNLPPPDAGQMIPIPMMAFVETEEGRIGMFTLVSRIDNDGYYLRYTKLQNDGDGANPWQLVAVFALPLGYRYTIMNVAGGYLLLQGIPEDLLSAPLPERPDFDCFSLNLQTLQLEWFCANKHMILSADLYAGFPPSLTPPTV
jgi:hypothetical protein